MQDIFVGRQAIYDSKLDVVAWELLFRSGQENVAKFDDPDSATSQVLLNTLVEIGLDNVVGDRPAFVNFTRGLLIGENTIPFEKNRIVVEVLEDIEEEEDVLNALRVLSQTGYQIALDDFVAENGKRELLQIADIIKIDVLALGQAAIADVVNNLRRYEVKLLAEKVETIEQFDLCKDLGFNLFQGYFLSRPKIVKGQRLSSNRLAVLQLLSQLQDPEATYDDLEKIICQDVALSFKLLRYVNSSAVGLRCKVDSIQHALSLLGRQRIQILATLITVAGLDQNPQALINSALVRGKMCELLAESLNRHDAPAFFTMGLFSTLDVLLKQPMNEILKSLPLSDQVKDAILDREGAMGAVLNCSMAYEHGEWGEVECLGLGASSIRDAYLNAVPWVEGKHGLVCQLRMCG